MATDDDKNPSGSQTTLPTDLKTESALDTPASPNETTPPVAAADSEASQNAWNSSEPTNVNAQPQERSQLLERARAFLKSPQVRLEDDLTTRRFLLDKGLTDLEISELQRGLPPQIPQIPPRTYPAPSNLLNLLMGLVRLFTWIAGGSTVITLIYYRYLLPKLTKTLHARQAIKSLHLELLRKLSTSLSSFKESQSESFSVLPRPIPVIEDTRFKDCHTLDELIAANGENGSHQDIPQVSILRCAIEEFVAGNENRRPSTEELCQSMVSKLPWLQSDLGPKYLHDLWQTLSTSSLFQHTETPDGLASLWSYIPPPPPPPPKPSPLTSSLSLLLSSLSHTQQPKSDQPRPFQHTLQTLSDFTGYITTQTYALPNTTSFRMPGMASGNLSPQEEEVKREIRALKGLVLNRRSFMPTISRPASTPSLRPTASVS